MTFKELRKQKNEAMRKLNIANKTVSLQIDNIQVLRRLLENEQKLNNILESKLEVEIKAKNRVKLKLVSVSHMKDKFYKCFINEVGKRNKDRRAYKTSLFVFGVVVLIIATLLLRG